MELAEIARMEQQEQNYWWHVGRRLVLHKVLASHIKPEGKLNILDIGCGTGINFWWLKEWGKVTGLDNSPEAIEYCREKYAYDALVLSDASKLPEGQFDLITAFDILEHIQDDTAVLTEWRRSLRRGGLILLTVPAHQWLFNKHDEVLHHRRRYSAVELRRKIESAGLTVRFISPFFFFVFPVFVVVRIVMGRRPRTTYETASAATHTEGILVWLSSLEAALMRRRIGLPVGTSILVVAEGHDI